MSNTFNWGIIGPGRIAERFAGALDVVDDAVLYAVASRDKERAKQFSDKYNASRCYGSYEELIEDNDVDAVYIATPHRFHFEQTSLCLNAGKPVLCEKPLTVNARQAKQLIRESRERNVFLMEGLWTRYLPVYAEVRKWLEQDRVGEIKLLTSTFGFKFARDYSDRLLNHDLAGGALLDLGVYNIAISQWVFGKNPEAFSTTGFIGETGVDEVTAVSLDFGDGRVSQFTCNLLTRTANDFHIYGSEGHICIHNMFWDTTQATLSTEYEEEIRVTRAFRGNGFEYEIEEAKQCIEKGLIESPGMTHADTLSNLELMDQIRAEIGLKYRFES